MLSHLIACTNQSETELPRLVTRQVVKDTLAPHGGPVKHAQEDLTYSMTALHYSHFLMLPVSLLFSLCPIYC